jgi:hypothetical protein
MCALRPLLHLEDQHPHHILQVTTSPHYRAVFKGSKLHHSFEVNNLAYPVFPTAPGRWSGLGTRNSMDAFYVS